MFNSTLASSSHTYFENSVGRLLEHPAGHYIAVEYRTGPRQLSDLQAFLLHAGRLLARWGWDKLRSPGGLMTAFSPEEVAWITNFWQVATPQRTDLLYWALLLPHEVFAQLSYKCKRQSMPEPHWQGAGQKL